MSDQPKTEAAAVRRVQQGDLAAFAALMELHVRRLRTFIALRAPVARLIDEIAHESCVCAYRRIGEFRPGDFGAWLRALAAERLAASTAAAAVRPDPGRQPVTANDESTVNHLDFAADRG